MPRPNRCAQVRLTSARAKNGFSGAVIHFASTGRYGSAEFSVGEGPPRNRAGTVLADSGRKSLAALRLLFSWTPILVLSPPLLAFFGLSARTFEKNAAMPQYSVCFQLVNGWVWHWAHWSWMPRKCCDTVSLSLSIERFARK